MTDDVSIANGLAYRKLEGATYIRVLDLLEILKKQGVGALELKEVLLMVLVRAQDDDRWERIK